MTAQILHFDPARARPGLRTLMLEMRARLQDSVAAGEWRAPAAREGISAADLIDLLGPADRLVQMHTAMVCDQAIQAAIAGIYAIHDGVWVPGDTGQALESLMTLQSEASRLIKLPMVRAAMQAADS